MECRYQYSDGGSSKVERQLKPVSADDQRQSDARIAKWTAESLRSISIVDDQGFRSFVQFVADLGSIDLKVPRRTQRRDNIRALAA